MQKIRITVETFVARPKKKIQILLDTQEKTRRCWLLEKARPPPSVNLGIGAGCLERGSQPMGGSFLRSCGWRRQSSEVLYVTYQHGLPFNQRVERKDKVKPSSLGTEKQQDLQQSHVRADKRVRHVTGLGNNNCSIRKKDKKKQKENQKVDRVKMECGGNVLVRPGQNACWKLFKFEVVFGLTYLRDALSTWVFPPSR